MGVYNLLFGKRDDKEKRLAALARQQEADEEHRDEVIHQGREAVRSAQLLVEGSDFEGVPRQEDVEEARRIVAEAVDVFEREGVEGALDTREHATLDRLQAHEAGAKAGQQKRLVATWTPAKQMELRELQRRGVIATVTAKTDDVIMTAQARVDALRAGHEMRGFLEKRVRSMPETSMHGSLKLMDAMLKMYLEAGWERADETMLQVELLLELQGHRFIQRMQRGHRGRVEFRARKWAMEKLLAQATALFKSLDATEDGELEIDELQEGFARAGYSRSEINMITRLLDADGSGSVDMDEFITSFSSVLSGKAKVEMDDEEEDDEGVSGINWDENGTKKSPGGGARPARVTTAGGKRGATATGKRETTASGRRQATASSNRGATASGRRGATASGNRGTTGSGLKRGGTAAGKSVWGDDLDEEGEAGLYNERGGSAGIAAIYGVEPDEEEEEEFPEEGNPNALPVDGGGNMGLGRTGATDHLFGEVHFASQQGDVVRIWALVARAGVSENAVTSAGTTPIHFAAAAGQPNACSLLASLGADVDRETSGGFTALHIAATGNQPKCIQALCAMRARPDYPDANHRAGPLHWAARGGHVHAVEALLEEGASIEMPDRVGNTPLMWAAKHGRTRVLHRLVEEGASFRVVNKEGRTALIHAAEQGHTETCMALVDLGLYPNEVMMFGQSPGYMAEARGHKETAKALQEALDLQGNVTRINEIEG